jgi:hypothetical protein
MIFSKMDKLIIRIQNHSHIEIFSAVFLSTLISLITFCVFDHYFEPGIDGSLPWVFNYLINGNAGLGREIIFPHGPLAFLTYPICIGNNWLIAVLFCCFLKTLLSFNVLYIFRLNDRTNWITPFFVALILSELFSIQFILIAVISTCYLLHFKTNIKTWVFLALFFCSLSIYIKSFVGTVTCIITFSFITIQFFKSRKFGQTILFITTWIIAVIAIWLLLYKSFIGFPRFVFGQFQLVQDNSSAVSIYPTNNWRLLSTAFVLFLILPFIHRNKQVNLFYLLFLGALFAAWKYGIAREDIQHIRNFWDFLLLFFSLFIVFIEKNKFLNLAVGGTILCLIYANSSNSMYYTEMQLNAIKINVFTDFVSNYKKLQEQANTFSENKISVNKLNENLLKMIGNKPVDIYPWDYSFIPANHLNWQPRPVIQSYASYTSWLDMQNSLHFKSKNAPAYLIWQLGKDTRDINKANLESIDNRYLLNDEPNTIISILDQYRLKNMNNKLLLFEKTSNRIFKEEKTFGSIKARWNDWIDVPEKEDGILRAKFLFDENFWGKVKSLLYKDAEFSISYQLEDLQVIKFRIVPKNAKDGLWINPLIMNPESKYIEPIVKKIMFQCSDPEIVNDAFTIVWELIGINKNALTAKLDSTSYPFKYAFLIFGKNDSGSEQKKPLFSTLNKFEGNLTHWSFCNTCLFKDDFVSAPYSFKLNPGKYSSTLILDFDSLLNDNKYEYLTISLSAFLKGTIGVKANYVISVEKGNDKIAYFTGKIQEFINDNSKWNHMIIRKNIYNKIPVKENVRLKVYIWNIGNVDLLMDDFKVDIDMQKLQ